jgi:hypothetical protein
VNAAARSGSMAAAPLPGSDQQPGNPRWFFRFFVGYTVIMLVLLGLLYVDFFSHLWAPDPQSGSVAYRLFLGLVLVPAAIVVSLLVLRRTKHNVTGLFLLIYAVLVMHSTLRIDSPLVVLNNLFYNAWIGFWLLPLYFPDGTAYPRRFQRWVRIYSVVTSILFFGVIFFQPDTEIYTSIGVVQLASNPLRLFYNDGLTDVVTTLQAVTWITSVLMIIPSLIMRYRGSKGLIRQQIKLFVWAYTLLIAIFLPLLPFFSETNRSDTITSPALRLFDFTYSYILIPAAPFVVVGYAILRHRLYDIDLIIRRTLVYSVLTAILVSVYFGVVTLLQTAFSRLIGGESALAVVISTLAIAGLFTPVRGRVQRLIDRAFYRKKYDAQKTIEQFGGTVRDEVDIDNLRAALIDVVQDAMQPERASLWLNSDQP